jgi:hypothetical protein
MFIAGVLIGLGASSSSTSMTSAFPVTCPPRRFFAGRPVAFEALFAFFDVLEPVGVSWNRSPGGLVPPSRTTQRTRYVLRMWLKMWSTSPTSSSLVIRRTAVSFSEVHSLGRPSTERAVTSSWIRRCTAECVLSWLVAPTLSSSDSVGNSSRPAKRPIGCSASVRPVLRTALCVCRAIVLTSFWALGQREPALGCHDARPPL